MFHFDQNTISIDHKKLSNYGAKILTKAGFKKENADMTANSLVLSNLFGHESHGIVQVDNYLRQLENKDLKPNASFTIINETPAITHADGDKGLGYVQMPKLLDNLIPKAKKLGTATGSLKNSGHVGRIGEWVEYAAHHGLCAMVTVNDNGAVLAVAPPGGKKACTSTNPIAVSIPLEDNSYFAFDFSTSNVAIGKIYLAYLSEKEVPAGLLQDHNGEATTNPDVLFKSPKGSLKPFGDSQSYKGFGLSVFVDCLTAGLSGGLTPKENSKDNPLVNNVIVQLWDPSHFAGLEHMQQQASKYLDFIKKIPLINDQKPIRIAGQRALQEKQKREKDGVPLSIGSIKKLNVHANCFDVDIPEEFREII